MPGQATVVIGDKSWSCSVASLPAEMTSGLSGVEGIAAETGMLFDMGTDYEHIDINTSEMLFSLDIIFINSGGQVVEVLHDVEPNESAFFDAGEGLGAKYFMEISSGEATSVSVGDTAVIDYTQEGLSLGSILGLVVVAGMVGMAVRSTLKR